MTDQPDQPRTPAEGTLRGSEWFGLATPDKDDTVHEIELTTEQATHVLQDGAVMFTSDPDILVDEDGTLIEREDARPPSP
jgi:hypothetical protein